MQRIIFVGLAATLLAVLVAAEAAPPATQPATQPETQPAQVRIRFIPSSQVARTNRIVFVCDAHDSMIPKFDAERAELRNAIESLRVPDLFNVIFFEKNAAPPIDKSLLLATPDNKQKVYDFIDKYKPGGETDPVPAIKVAFAMHPDLMFFLCDPRNFPDPKGTIKLFKTLNADGKCKVDTIAFLQRDDAGEAMLKQIAADSKGRFTIVSDEDFGKKPQ